MRIFFISRGTESDAPTWAKNLWAFARVCEEVVPMQRMEGLVEAQARIGWLRRLTFGLLDRSRAASRIERSLHPNEANVLWIEAFSGRELLAAQSLKRLSKAFTHRVLVVNDMIHPDWPSMWRGIDPTHILSFSSRLAESWGRATGVPAAYLCPSTDVLRHHSISSYRPIDVLTIGRRDRQIDAVVSRHFRRNGSSRLYIDPAPKSQGSVSMEDEYRGLLDLYGKANVSMCFEASNVPRYRGCSALNERWIHAWAGGCTVVGRAPKDPDERAMMSWPESHLEVPSDIAEVVPFIESILDDEEGLRRRRLRNVAEVMARHDTRRRLAEVFSLLGLPLTPELRHGLSLLDGRVSEITREPQRAA